MWISPRHLRSAPWLWLPPPTCSSGAPSLNSSLNSSLRASLVGASLAGGGSAGAQGGGGLGCDGGESSDHGCGGGSLIGGSGGRRSSREPMAEEGGGSRLRSPRGSHDEGVQMGLPPVKRVASLHLPDVSSLATLPGSYLSTIARGRGSSPQAAIHRGSNGKRFNRIDPNDRDMEGYPTC